MQCKSDARLQGSEFSRAGSIEFDGANVDCTIRNLAPAGAALDVVCPVVIPHEITLNIMTRQARQHGYVVWRRERRVGIMFAQKDDEAGQGMRFGAR